MLLGECNKSSDASLMTAIRYVPYLRRQQEQNDSGLDCICCSESVIYGLVNGRSPWSEMLGDYPSHTRAMIKTYCSLLSAKNERHSIPTTSIIKYPQDFLNVLHEMLAGP